MGHWTLSTEASLAAGERGGGNPLPGAAARMTGSGTSLACHRDTMRTPSRIRHCLVLLALAVGPMAFAAASRAEGTPGADSASAELEDPRGLESIAQKEAALHLPPLSDRQRLIAGPIEAHVSLKRCSRPVTPVVSAGAHMRDRILVELRCPGTPP